MTSTTWNNSSYYGRKLKKNFMIMSKMVEKSVDKDYQIIPETISVDTFIKLTGRMESHALAVNKIIQEIDTIQRIKNIEEIFTAIPVEILAKAKLEIGQ